MHPLVATLQDFGRFLTLELVQAIEMCPDQPQTLTKGHEQ